METFKDKLLQTIKNINSDYFTAKQLYGILQTHSTAERKAINDALSQLESDCEIFFDARNHRYRLVNEADFGKAEFQGNARGFGFLIREQGEDLFVPASKTNGAFHKDTVLYRRVKDDEAEVVKILSRGMSYVVGTYDKTNNARFVLPDDQHFASDIYVQPKRDMGAKNGQKVVARITVYPTDNRNSPEGEIVEILGFPKEKNVDMLSVAKSFGLTQSFPPVCQRHAEAIAQTLDESDLSGRRDLRNRRIFTIDGDDAKDLDDAVSIVKNADGTYTLGVHIADVSHYVKPAGDIDKEAFARGTSVYLPEMVFPMLPRELSNGICSLFEQVDRLTLSCEMTINNVGKVVDYDIFPSVINSCHRMTYTAVQAIFDGVADDELLTQYSDVVDDLFAMKELAEILQRKRDKRGNIEFQSKEVYFVHDDKGMVVDVRLQDNSFSHQLIEEFMIVANETVAEYAETCCYPFVYRVHARPDEQKLAVLLALMRGLGINVKRSQEIHNSVLQDALMQAKNTPFFNLVNDVMLRTMQKAKYSDVNTGHFGLASRCYCHFTSPIRRYPDLVVHRILKTAISGKMTEKAYRAYEDMCYDAAKQASIREKLADEAERKADDVKKCAYAERVVGQTFEAVISGVTERGIYAELANTVEGGISVDKMGGRFTYNPQQFCLYNDAVKYSLGDSLTIRVASVNKQALKIDFDISPVEQAK